MGGSPLGMESNDQENSKSVLAMEIHGAEVR
jgi:hypothetical protein